MNSKNLLLALFNRDIVLFFIAVEPEVTISGASRQFVVVGNSIQLTCHYNSSPPASEVQWRKDGDIISRNDTLESDARGNITNLGESQVQLTISSSMRNDGGNYTCVVTNSVNNSSATTAIVIQG